MGVSPLLRLLAPVRVPLAVSALLQAVAAVASIVPFVCVVEIARRLLAAPADEAEIRALVVVAVAAFGLRLLAHGISGQITHLADNTFQLGVRRRVAARLGRLPLGWFGARHSGEVKRAVHDDVAAMHYMVAHSLPDLVAGVVAPLAALVYLVTIDWRLTLITLAPVVVFAVLYVTIVRGYSSRMSEHAAALGRVNAAVVELVQGIAVVKAFGAAGRPQDRYVRSTEAFADFHEEWVRPIALRSALAELACSPPVMLLTVVAGGAALVRWGGMEPVDVVAFVLLGLGLSAPLVTLGYSAQGFRLAADAGGRVASLLALPELPQPVNGRAPCDERVELRDVAFAYDDRGDVLTDVSVALEPGTVTALVGASGAGKSTLAALIPRFWDVNAGAVTVGGVDVRDVRSADLYAHVAFVFQDPGLLRTSVRDNIRLARPDADDGAVEAAARAAQIHARVMELPRGYGSVVGDDARLSGGEAQRVAIARALLADRPILVLDEATAFADPESEAAIQDALSRLAAGRTLVVIAHRLSTVAGADQILVLSAGRVVERGRHAELLAADGEYARLWRAHERAT
jgi:ATP-binding cassette subfamily B protein